MTDRPSAPFLPYGRHEIDAADVAAVIATLEGGLLTQGPAVEAFEAALADSTGARHAVAVASGTAALHLAMAGLGLGPDDVGVTSPITFVASAACLRYVGARVAFADVDATTGLVTPELLEARIQALKGKGQRASVVIPVELNGQPVDRAGIWRVAQAHGARVVIDACHSLGASYLDGSRRRPIGDGAHADAVTLSFHPVKHITTAEGGAILTNDGDLARRLRRLRHHGMERDPARLERPADDPFAGPWYHEQHELGFNYRLSDLQCALGLSQLKRLPGRIGRRRALAARYDRLLKPHRGWLRPVSVRRPGDAAYHLYVVQLVRRPEESIADVARRRRRLYEGLRDHGIGSQVHYLPVPWMPTFRGQVGPDDRIPGAEAYYAGSLSIPLFPAMTESDVDRVVETLRRLEPVVSRARHPTRWS